MKSERLSVLVTPEEKNLIDERARQAGVNASEFVRRAVVAYDPEIDMEELQALAEQLGVMVDQTEQKLDANLAEIARLREQLADTEAIKAAALAELEASDVTWPFAVPSVSRAQEKADA